MRLLGIDEAGRGCVLGDLVIAGFVIDDPDDHALRRAGAADSKTVPAPRRRDACAKLQALGRAEVRRVSAASIDDGNLNTLEEEVIIALIRATEPDHVQRDALGHPATLDPLRRRILAALPAGLRPAITIEPKADATYAVVGAASMFAKTVRDDVLDSWREAFGDFGSGYPSDPKTRRWLASWAVTGKPWPEFVRSRWATVAALSQPTLFGAGLAARPKHPDRIRSRSKRRSGEASPE